MHEDESSQYNTQEDALFQNLPIRGDILSPGIVDLEI